jgi:hypothetical protein
MRLCRKFSSLAAFVLLCRIGFGANDDADSKGSPGDGVNPAATPAPATPGKTATKGDKTKTKDKEKGRDKEKPKDKKKPSPEDQAPAATPAPGAADKARPTALLYLPQGQPAKGLKIPYGPLTKPTMLFDIGEALKTDDDHVQFQDMQVELFDEDAEHNMKIDLPASVLDLNTNVLSSHVAATIKRGDFEVTGDNLEFDTQTKKGKLVGHVRMLIYDLKDSAGPAETPATPPASPAKVK